MIYITTTWSWFCLAIAVLLLTTFIMGQLSKQFYTMHIVLRRFSIIDLEFPAFKGEIKEMVKDIYRLDPAESQRTLWALRKHLWVDFLFMPAAYGSNFLVCMNVAGKLNCSGQTFYVALAWAQAIPWILDVIENIYLLNSLHPSVKAFTPIGLKAWQWLEKFKWGLSLLGMVSGVSALLYFWLTGRYLTSSLPYLAILIGEVLVFIIISLLSASKKQATPLT
ncbi:hypothetical protein ACDQ55_20370 [Chitinophaga sp. 30R24]|uniref:hypothetical protein n=1 Tax=Chitinophaga sp. 30R24 TaxID=3248838 RepID=UPI003B8F659E